MKKLSIIIPVFNEEKTIEKLLKKVIDVDLGNWQREILIVDDGSTDKTLQVLSKSQISNLPLREVSEASKSQIIKHKRNMGKGAAIQTGLKYVKGDAVIVQDADLEYDPKDIKKLLQELDKGEAEIIFGARNISIKDQLLYIWGINLSTLLINLFYGSKLSDLYTCYKLYKTAALRSVRAKAHGFEWDIELIVGLLKKGYKIAEVPISYKPRKFSEGKKIKPWDGVVGLWVIIKNRF